MTRVDTPREAADTEARQSHVSLYAFAYRRLSQGGARAGAQLQMGRADLLPRRLLPAALASLGPRAGASRRQAVLLDLPNRRFYFFNIEFWPQDIYYLTGALILAAVGLFLVTSLAGRVWCGYACPQTVWTDLFMWVERRVEGDRNAAHAARPGAGQLRQVWRKVVKHAVWLGIAFWTGGAWIMYFVDAPTPDCAILARRGRRPEPIFSSACSLSRPICWPAGRASRSAPICARGRASRPRCSTSRA